jgi:hypothetical protein
MKRKRFSVEQIAASVIVRTVRELCNVTLLDARNRRLLQRLSWVWSSSTPKSSVYGEQNLLHLFDVRM